MKNLQNVKQWKYMSCTKQYYSLLKKSFMCHEVTFHVCIEKEDET